MGRRLGGIYRIKGRFWIVVSIIINIVNVYYLTISGIAIGVSANMAGYWWGRWCWIGWRRGRALEAGIGNEGRCRGISGLSSGCGSLETCAVVARVLDGAMVVAEVGLGE